MRFYTWKATRGAPKGQIRYGSWWISKEIPKHDLVFVFNEFKGGEIEFLQMYFRRLDKAYEEATTRAKSPMAVKLIMAAKSIMIAEKAAIKRPPRATGFDWSIVH